MQRNKNKKNGRLRDFFLQMAQAEHGGDFFEKEPHCSRSAGAAWSTARFCRNGGRLSGCLWCRHGYDDGSPMTGADMGSNILVISFMLPCAEVITAFVDWHRPSSAFFHKRYLKKMVMVSSVKPTARFAIGILVLQIAIKIVKDTEEED